MAYPSWNAGLKHIDYTVPGTHTGKIEVQFIGASQSVVTINKGGAVTNIPNSTPPDGPNFIQRVPTNAGDVCVISATAGAIVFNVPTNVTILDPAVSHQWQFDLGGSNYIIIILSDEDSGGGGAPGTRNVTLDELNSVRQLARHALIAALSVKIRH